MKYLHRLFMTTALALSIFGFSSAANAVLITQDVISDDLGTVASVSIQVDDSYLGNGLLDSAFSPNAFELVDVTIYGLPSFILEVYDLQVILDGDNIFAGLEFLYINAIDLFEDFGLGKSWAYQIGVDAFDPGYGFIDIFNITSGGVVDYDLNGGVTFGNPTFVPEPSTLALFGLALAAFGFRRRQR